MKSFVRLAPASVPVRRKNAKRGTASPTAAQLEKPTQRALLKWLRMVLPIGSVVAATMNEAPASAKTEAQRARFYEARRASGVVTGWPDLTLAVAGGPAVFLETKRPKGGVLSVAQQDVHAALRAAGFFVAVASSIESARFALQMANVPLREAPGQLAEPARFTLEKRKPSLASELPF